MRFGLSIFLTDETITPAEVGRLAEQRGFDSLWLPEHTHMPLDHSPFPRGGDVPRQYLRTLDPFVALTAAAAATETLLLGFGICLITQRDPIICAKAVATLDRLSGGRVLFGVGAGWNRPEVERHGTPFERRFGVMRERVEAMRALWTQDVAAYDGRYVSFGPTWQWPKPVQHPLPVYVGGNGEQVLDRVLRYGDHWLPNREWDLETRIPELRRRAAEAGRPRPEVTYFGADLDPAMVERLANAGVDRILLHLPPAGRVEVEAAIDQARRAAGEHGRAVLR
jgi:probable F420-dependent oxidoreductase